MENCEKNCGGCPLRHLSLAEYQQQKEQLFKSKLQNLSCQQFVMDKSLFVPDGHRRRACFAFMRQKGKLLLGFNQEQSHQIYDVSNCYLLTERLNRNLQNLHNLADSLKVPKGDMWVLDSEVGIDITFEFPQELSLDSRMDIFELVQNCPDIIRISHLRNANYPAEPVIEKAKPYIHIGRYQVFVSADTFLQPSAMSEQSLIGLVQTYLSGVEGNIADLFCGLGTFSYVLAENKKNQILAADSSTDLLENFKTSINKNMISNIKICKKNLFKYPLDEAELKGVKAVVFDPPRAGALAQVRAIIKSAYKPQVVVAVSCNTDTFIRDANVLCAGGY